MSGQNLDNDIKVAIARGIHLFPFRTEKLSLVTPMVLRNSGRVWWMPWRLQAKKDVAACEKPWGAGKRALIHGCPNEGTHPQGYLEVNT